MRVLLCLLLAASAANAGELRNLKGETVKGNVVSVDADDKGENFKFVQKDGTERTISTTKVLALYFQRQVDPAAKPILCRVNDVHKNLLFAAEVKKDADGFTVVTSCGATLKYTDKQMARLDYSKGKLAYLSELTPSSVKET